MGMHGFDGEREVRDSRSRCRYLVKLVATK